MGNVKDMVGRKIGRLTVISFAGYLNDQASWNCKCECGNESVVRGYALRIARVRSCGCLQVEIARAGHIRHGMDNSPTYRSWHAMKSRCTNPNVPYYENYGGRGISFCEKWEKFEGFLDDMGVRPEGTSLERKDSNGNYCKDNCKWGTSTEQARNKRTTVFIEINGVKRCVSEWAEITGVSKGVIRSRMLYGWPKEHLFDPPGSQGKKSKFQK